jgi:hypothetical protein
MGGRAGPWHSCRAGAVVAGAVSGVELQRQDERQASDGDISHRARQGRRGESGDVQGAGRRLTASRASSLNHHHHHHHRRSLAIIIHSDTRY